MLNVKENLNRQSGTHSPDILIFFTLLLVLLSTSTLIAIDSPW